MARRRTRHAHARDHRCDAGATRSAAMRAASRERHERARAISRDSRRAASSIGNSRGDFRFDGRDYQGYAGDTLASALLANGVRLFGRSFKYHRPRGVLSAGPEEPNALMELRSGARREPNTRATVTELYDGLEAHSQNRWPSLRFDVQAINSLFLVRLRRGLLLQDVHVAGALLGKSLRAADSSRRGPGSRAPRKPTRTITKNAGPIATCWSLVAGRRASPRHSRRREQAPASSWRMKTSRSAAAAWRSVARSTASRRRPGLPSAIDELRVDAGGSPACHARPCSAVFDDGMYGAVERVNDHLPQSTRNSSPGSGCGASLRSRPSLRPARSSARWSSATTTCRASCWRARSART